MCDGLVGPAEYMQHGRVPVVRLRRVGVELEGSAVLRRRPMRIPVVPQPDETQRGVCFVEPLIDLQRLERSRFGCGEGLVRSEVGVEAEQVVAVGDAGVGAGVIRVPLQRLLKIL